MALYRENLRNIEDHNRKTLTQCQTIPFTALSKIFFRTFFPSTCDEHIPAEIKNDQVRIRPGSKRALPILKPEGHAALRPHRIDRHTFDCFTQRTPPE